MFCCRAVVTLLSKKGNLQDIRNWRPVSLLHVDYKILSNGLANRLREGKKQVLHQDQTFCVPGRCMVNNIYQTRDILEVSLDIDTGLISLHQEKAFGHVEQKAGSYLILEKKMFLSAYANDIIVLINNQKDVNVLAILTILLNWLCAVRVNWQKSEALNVGRSSNCLLVLP